MRRHHGWRRMAADLTYKSLCDKRLSAFIPRRGKKLRIVSILVDAELAGL